MEEVIKVDDCVGNIGDYDIPIHNAIIVSEGTTNGDMIKAMFSDAEIKEIRGSFDKDKLLGYRTWLGGRSQDYFLDWWDAPYEKSEEKTSEQQPNRMTDNFEKQSTDTDCVSRNSLLSKLDTCYKDKIRVAPDNMAEGFMQVEKLIKQEPPITPQRKIGKWVKHDTGHSIYYDCSLCGCVAPCTETADSFIWKLSNYCPDCGAKMKVEK